MEKEIEQPFAIHSKILKNKMEADEEETMWIPDSDCTHTQSQQCPDITMKWENIDNKRENIDNKRENIDNKWENIHNRLENTDSRLENTNSKFENIDTREKDALLKDVFVRKVTHDKEFIKKALFEMVEAHIAKNVQPICSTLTLSDNITGGRCYFQTYKHPLHKKADLPLWTKDKYCILFMNVYHLPFNDELKFLVENAITPLGLKWTIEFLDEEDGELREGYVEGYVRVSWTHWQTE